MQLKSTPRYVRELFTGELKHRLVHKYSRSRKHVFTAIYARGYWLRSQQESRSGEGSTAQATVNVRRILEGLFSELGVKTFLDAPCGDFNWMRLTNLDGVSYTGADIVPSVVEHNKRTHTAPGRQFRQLDLCNEGPGVFDLVLCRDCIQHLTNREVALLLRNISLGGSRYLLITTTPTRRTNEDMDRTGGFRPINLEAPPWNIPNIERRFVDCESDDQALQKHLLLIKLPLPDGWPEFPGGL